MCTSDLKRFEQFLAIPPEDIQARAVLALSRADLGSLHTRAVMGEVKWDYYHAVTNAWKADLVYRHDGLKQGWTIAFIREEIGRKAYRHYTSSGEDIHEWLSGRIFPTGWYLQRIRKRRNPVGVLEEVELALRPETDLGENKGVGSLFYPRSAVLKTIQRSLEGVFRAQRIMLRP